MKRMLLEMFLLEGKRENIAYCIKHGIDPRWVDIFANQWDPTPTKKYTFTILRWAAKFLKDQKNNPDSRQHRWKLTDDDVLDEFTYRFRTHPELFRLNPFKFFYENMSGDIQQFKTLDEFLNDISIIVNNNELSKKKQYKVAKDESARTNVFENDKCIIYYIKKKEAACIYGKGTKWCITQRHMPHFESYNKDASIYFIIDKKNNDNKFAVLSMRAIVESQTINLTTKYMDIGKTSSPVNLDIYNPADDLIFCSDVTVLREWFEGIYDECVEEYISSREIEVPYDESPWEYIDAVDFNGEFVSLLVGTGRLIDFNEICNNFGIPNGEEFFTYRPKDGENNDQ